MDHHNESPKASQEHPVPLPKAPGNDLSIPLAIVFSGILIAGAIIFTDKSSGEVAAIPAEEPVKISEDILQIKADDHISGNPNADVVIIEYSDVQCPFCQRFHETMIAVMNTYGASGKVAWVYRHFPLDAIHPYARKGAEALECANEMGGTQAFLKLQNEMFASETTNIDPKALPQLAVNAGLDRNTFSACLSSGKFAERVDRDFKEGASVGVRGTPYSIAWNRKTHQQEVINGAQPLSEIELILGMVGVK